LMVCPLIGSSAHADSTVSVEASVSNGLHDTGHAIARGAHDVGHAMSNGAHVVGHTFERGARQVRHAFGGTDAHNGPAGNTEVPAPPKLEPLPDR
jgi:hypothetical protein